MKLTKLSDKDLYGLCKEYGQKARFWRRKFAGLLPEVERRGLYRRRRCSSIYEFAAKLAGMSQESVDTILRISRKLEDKPELKALLESGAQSWTKLERVAYIATPKTDSYWAEQVLTLPLSGLKVFVQNDRLNSTVDRNSEPVKSANTPKRSKDPSESEGAFKQDLQLKLSHALATKLQQLSKRADFESLLGKFMEEVKRQEEAEKPEAVASPSRHVPTQIEKYVRERTGDLCAFPSCFKPGESLHHTQRWALENVHDTDRLHLLCTSHERLAHRGYIENEQEAPEFWRLRDYPSERGAITLIDELVNVRRGG